MRDSGTSYVPHLMLTSLIAIWAGSFVVAKVTMNTVTPFALVTSRFVIGCLCILPFFLRTPRELRQGTFGPGVLAGLVLAVPYFLQMYGVRETTASMGGFVTGLIVLLVAVEVVGSIGMGAQRWINLGIIKLQPSELMKVGLALALARYFHGISTEDVRRIPYLFVPLMLIAMPSALVLKQPDLGTALFLIMMGGAVFFVAGVRLWKFCIVLAATGAAVPIVWSTLRSYQQKRILTFLDPESDPLGAGYHILQSKIALGSGGLFGKGFMQGSQSHLNFLPEKQTDFIFTMMAEEFGMVGGLVLLGLYILIMIYGFAIGLRSRSHFGRLLALGLTSMLFLYVFINIAMVMGLIPVVGVPLPLISYGGTAMLTLMIGFGFLINVYVHRDVTISRTGGGDG